MTLHVSHISLSLIFDEDTYGDELIPQPSTEGASRGGYCKDKLHGPLMDAET